MTALTHEPIKAADNENTNEEMVYSTDKGSIRRACYGNRNILLNF